MRSKRTFTERARRDQIIVAATDLMAEVGYGNTSVRKIAERVGVAMSVVLYHFTNKDEIVRGVLEAAIDGAAEAVLPAVDAEQTAAGKLRIRILANATYLRADAKRFGVIIDIGTNYRSTGGGVETIELSPDVAERFARLDFEPILRLGIERGEFAGIDTRMVATLLSSALNGVLTEVLRDPDFDVDAYGVLVADMAAMLVRGGE
ncbi:TetR/AcrR family transcriptional regulator [Tsukamurella sp. 8F]|uniref:TetR/AcrR family transcriptional regulator n=1 Tax=unclassified Tsukamurella TaxID=2633480 RepID=UPI0023B953B9|nr:MULTISPECIES: TetR/AcrR family transcriptional regulator [unclassified Tsukamurella]MDF0530760.1 TetR/AcrR family transcriptional regulator [Tsukamurella sp. 8J]MDF0587961.1 TetR/AcrR family transcriptional regulator [Tsukamurella sp. 8F]